MLANFSRQGDASACNQSWIRPCHCAMGLNCFGGTDGKPTSSGFPGCPDKSRSANNSDAASNQSLRHCPTAHKLMSQFPAFRRKRLPLYVVFFLLGLGPEMVPEVRSQAFPLSTVDAYRPIALITRVKCTVLITAHVPQFASRTISEFLDAHPTPDPNIKSVGRKKRLRNPFNNSPKRLRFPQNNRRMR